MYILPVEPSSNDWENNEEFEGKSKNIDYGGSSVRRYSGFIVYFDF